MEIKEGDWVKADPESLPQNKGFHKVKAVVNQGIILIEIPDGNLKIKEFLFPTQLVVKITDSFLIEILEEKYRKRTQTRLKF